MHRLPGRIAPVALRAGDEVGVHSPILEAGKHSVPVTHRENPELDLVLCRVVQVEQRPYDPGSAHAGVTPQRDHLAACPMGAPSDGLALVVQAL